MVTFAVDQIELLGLAVAVLAVGVLLRDRLPFLEKNFIPVAVVGGLLFSALIWLLRDGFGRG